MNWTTAVESHNHGDQHKHVRQRIGIEYGLAAHHPAKVAIDLCAGLCSGPTCNQALSFKTVHCFRVLKAPQHLECDRQSRYQPAG
jgi:hypothetical protein